MDIAERAERSHRAWYAALGRHGGRWIERDGVSALVMEEAPERSVLNAVVYEPGTDVGAAYGWLEDAYAGVDAWTVWVPQEDRDTARALEAKAHVLDADPAVMAFELDAFEPPAGLPDWRPCDIDLLADVNDAAYPWRDGSMARGIRAAVSTDDHRLYAVEESCVLGIFDHEGDAYVTFVATLPEARGRGLAGGLLAAALVEARDRGCQTTSLVATKLGQPVYARLGYRSVGVYEMWEKRRA